MADIDSFQLNIDGAENLVDSGINKTNVNDTDREGIDSEYMDILELPMSDEELLTLRDEYEEKNNGYSPKIKPRQEKNKVYYVGKQRSNTSNLDQVVSSNLIFEAEETFIPQALSKNPEPVVWSDNTEEGKAASNDIKTMLQYHADVLCLRRTLGVMVRHWSIYLTAVVKHGWDVKNKDITLDIRKPQNFVFDPDGYIDVYGNYVGAFLGERIESSAQKLIDLYPKHKDYIFLKVDGKLGTQVKRTEWWTDEYCFTTFEDKVLDKHKNEYFNYDSKSVEVDEFGLENETATPGINHFGNPKMPYTFLSVFSLQERPHDITNLIEQSIPNQDRINDRDDQISRNLRASNNSLVLSGVAFNSETARTAAQAVEDGNPILSPNGDTSAVVRLPASPLPNGVLQALETDKQTLRSVFGTEGLTSEPDSRTATARGMILNQSHDSTRIGGGIGDALEQLADNVFNWWLQLYCVFYDEPHYGAIMGNGRAVEYVTIVNTNLTRKFVVSVSPNSMSPKDEISEQNQAVELWGAKALDPISLFKKLNYPDPMETAKQVALWTTNPQLYMQMYFPEQAQQAPPQPGQIPPQPDSPPESLAEPAASSSLSQVPISTSAAPQ